MKTKKLLITLLTVACFATLSSFILIEKESVRIEATVCRWKSEQCPEGGWRVVCLEDGVGYKCECGSVKACQAN